MASSPARTFAAMKIEDLCSSSHRGYKSSFRREAETSRPGACATQNIARADITVGGPHNLLQACPSRASNASASSGPHHPAGYMYNGGTFLVACQASSI